MRYNLIRMMDISNGPGVRVSIFMQGCEFRCENCFNPETWDFRGGKEFTDSTIKEILDYADKDHIEGLSILGGEPLHPKNIEGTARLAKAFKERYPNKNVWVWTGYLFEELSKDEEVFKYIDVLVDGRYVDELHDFNLKWRGSSNQRVIDIEKSLKANEIVLCER
jgi:anaerobic ribonucleoside-triphosphate reductase activating protein